MKFSRLLLVSIASVSFTAGALAQLKLPRDAQPATAPATAAPQAAQPDPANAEKEEAGKLAAAGWLVLLDRRDWGSAWETSSSVFRSAVPLPTWMDGIPKAREPLGNFMERSPVESVYKTKLEGRPPGEYVTVLFDSKFQNKEVQEMVTTVRDKDGKWRVTGYSTR